MLLRVLLKATWKLLGRNASMHANLVATPCYQRIYSAFLSFLPTHFDSSIDHLRNALDRISSWMTANLLTLNSSKTEFLLIGLSKQLAKINNSSLTTPCYQRRTFRGLSVFVCWASPMRRAERLNRSRRVHVGPKESHNIRWTAH